MTHTVLRRGAGDSVLLALNVEEEPRAREAHPLQKLEKVGKQIVP